MANPPPAPLAADTADALVAAAKTPEEAAPVLAWHRLELLYIVTGTDNMLLGRRDMSAAWKLFLFGNGSPTHHLGLLSGSLTEVDVIGHEHIGEALDGAQEHISEIPAPRCRRQVWLRNARAERLGYAASWLNEGDVGKVFKNQKIPIGKNILQNRTELFRDMKSVFCGTSAELEEAFGFKGPFWGRSYLFWKGGRPVTFIYEVFSPALEKYMGPVLVDHE